MAKGLVSIQTPRIEGVRETLRELNEFEPKLQRATRREMRDAAKPLEGAVRNLLPGAPPMSGWAYGRLAYDGGTVRGGVRTVLSTRATRSTRSEWPLLTLTQRAAAGVVFDMAGRRSSGATPQGRAFIAVLNRRHGRASRSMWRAAEDRIDVVRSEVVDAINKASAEVNRRMEP